MKSSYKTGDTASIVHTVSAADTAAFGGVEVHPVYATFAVAREAEWAGRQFVLQMKEDYEEGIGTFVEIYHHAPAFIGEKVVFVATISLLEKNKIECTITAKVGERLIATGKTGQKIIDKNKLKSYFATLNEEK